MAFSIRLERAPGETEEAFIDRADDAMEALGQLRLGRTRLVHLECSDLPDGWSRLVLTTEQQVDFTRPRYTN